MPSPYTNSRPGFAPTGFFVWEAGAIQDIQEPQIRLYG